MKQFDPVIKTISENTFYIRPFPAFRAANLMGEISSVIAPLVSVLTPFLGAKSSETPLDMDINDAAPAIAGAFSSISGDKLETLIKKLLVKYGNITVEYFGETEAERLTEDAANEIFCGEAQDMFMLAFEVIRINYNGFFKKLGSLFGSVTELTAKRPPSAVNTGA